MSWFRRRAPRAAFDAPLPDEWRRVVESSVPHFDSLRDDERRRLDTEVRDLVDNKRWEAARGFALSDEMKVTIASQAALLVLGLAHDAYRNVGTIIVHPTTVTLTGPRGGPIAGTVSDAPLPILGQAHFEGPVVVAWDEALANTRHPERGHNVVYHEFAHKLDMLDGLIDGTPPLDTRAHVDRWVEVCTAEYEALRNGHADPLLDGYAAVNPGEFFAVATEVFFSRPIEMEQAKADLYDVLRDFYRQDPARRVRHSEG